MSTPALEHWFSLDIRRNRKSFMLSMVALFVTFAVAYFVWLTFAETNRGKSMGLLVFGIPAAISSYLLVAQRLRDFGVSGWFALLWLPINAFEGEVRAALTLAAIVVLCGIPGTTGPNKIRGRPPEFWETVTESSGDIAY
jgi:uncharacterized membrane protein YhaH (DUF805 family)